MSILNTTTEALVLAHQIASDEASKAAKEFRDRHFGGQDGGACGFAWVTFYPQNKGNTRLGKQERRMIESLGFRKDYTGKAWQLWDPSRYPGQSVDAKSAGAVAYAKTLEQHAGVKVYAGDRLD